VDHDAGSSGGEKMLQMPEKYGVQKKMENVQMVMPSNSLSNFATAAHRDRRLSQYEKMHLILLQL